MKVVTLVMGLLRIRPVSSRSKLETGRCGAGAISNQARAEPERDGDRPVRSRSEMETGQCVAMRLLSFALLQEKRGLQTVLGPNGSQYFCNMVLHSAFGQAQITGYLLIGFASTDQIQDL